MRQQSKYGMPVPNTRGEMEHNVALQIDELITLPKDSSVLQNRLWALGNSLDHLRFLPNGRIYLPAIDERLRLMSNMQEWMRYLPEERLLKSNNRNNNIDE